MNPRLPCRRRCLLLAERDDFLQYAVTAARLLRNLYANQRQPASYQALNQQYLQLRQRLAGEEEAEDLHHEIRNAIAGPVTMKRALLPKMADYIARLQELHKLFNTFNTATFLYRARLTQEEMLGNFTEILRITHEATEQLRAGQLNGHRFDLRYNQYMTVYAYLRSRQAAQGLDLAAQYEQDFHPASNNWFAFQENHVLLAKTLTSFLSPVQVLAHLRERALTNDLPQVILLDLNMPVLNGWDVLEALKPLESQLLGRCLVYILTSTLASSFTSRVRDHALVAGIIPKPLDLYQIQVIKTRTQWRCVPIWEPNASNPPQD